MTQAQTLPGPASARDAKWRPALIRTKLVPPYTRHQIARHNALQLLSRGTECKLTALVAPAGFGKTTLLCEWRNALLEQAYAVAWLSIDREDDDLVQFTAYLLAAVQQASAEVGDRMQQLLRNDYLAPVEALLAELLNEVAAWEGKLVLILDDFDRLRSGDIHEAVFRLLRYAPENLHIAIAGRSEPPIPLSYFASRGQLLRLGPEDLRFDPAETQAFFSKTAGVTLDGEQTRKLLSATEGWVAGLQLASLALKQGGEGEDLAAQLPRARRDIASYLSENVMAHVPGEMLDFLLDISILDRLSAALCNAVTGRDDARKNLEWLLAGNMFLRPLDAEWEWYRFHALFTDYLRKRLQEERAEDIAGLHRRASAWYAGQSLWPEAVKHALAAGDVDQAASWVERCAMTLVEASDVRTVLTWLAKLPHEAIQGRLRLRLVHAWALALSLQTVLAQRELRAVEADIARDRSVADSIGVELAAVKALIAGLSDASRDSLELGRSVLDMRPEPNSWEEGIGLTTLVFGLAYASEFDEVQRLRDRVSHGAERGAPLYATVYRQSMVGLSLFVEGRLEEAVTTLEHALGQANASAGSQSAAAVLPVGYLAAIRYEWNHLERVAEILRGRLDIALQACSLGPLAGFCITLARLAFLNGDVDEANGIVERAEAVAKERGWLRLQVACKAEAIRLAIRAGNLGRAASMGHALETLLPGENPQALSGSQRETWQRREAALCRLLIARGRATEALPRLRAMQAEARVAGMRYVLSQVTVLLAVATLSAGQPEDAAAAIGEAVIYGQDNGLCRVFLDEGEPAREILHALRKRPDAFPGVESWYIEKVLAGLDATGNAAAAPVRPAAERPPERTAASRLSAREVEILDYVARGLSNKEIARALRVAPETIKWHLKNIYEKLSVTSRIQAIQSGLGMDLPRHDRPKGHA